MRKGVWPYWIFNISGAERFMPDGRGLLAMHASSGITFNLEAMPNVFLGTRPVHFRAVAGLANSQGLADVWVFLDGQVTAKRLRIRSEDGAIPLKLAIGPHDRFLTLATSDGGNGQSYDWVVFGDPLLEMAVEEDGSKRGD